MSDGGKERTDMKPHQEIEYRRTEVDQALSLVGP